MIEGTLQTTCPEMYVRPVLKGLAALLNPRGPRMTDELSSPSVLTINDVTGIDSHLTPWEKSWEFELVFPPTEVLYNTTHRPVKLPTMTPFGEPIEYPDWIREKVEPLGGGYYAIVPDLIVAPVRAYVGDPANPSLEIFYAEEASVFNADHDVFALPCDGVGRGTLPDGRQVKIYSQLPTCEGHVDGRWFWQFRRPWKMSEVQVTSRVVLA